MRVVIVVKQHSEFASEAEMWKRDFEYEARKEVELIDPETIDGEMFARARDIVQYGGKKVGGPAITTNFRSEVRDSRSLDFGR